MKALRSSTRRSIQSDGVSSLQQNGLSQSALDEAKAIGLVSYSLHNADLDLIRVTVTRDIAFSKIDVVTTLNFYNDVCLAFALDVDEQSCKFARKLYEENGMFMLETIYVDCSASTCTFTFRFMVTEAIFKWYMDLAELDAAVAALVNDMCKVCIDSALDC